MKKLQDLYNRFVQEEDAALDQWISVLVLAILALVIYVALRPTITDMLNNSAQGVGNRVDSFLTDEAAGG